MSKFYKCLLLLALVAMATAMPEDYIRDRRSPDPHKYVKVYYIDVGHRGYHGHHGHHGHHGNHGYGGSGPGWGYSGGWSGGYGWGR